MSTRSLTSPQDKDYVDLIRRVQEEFDDIRQSRGLVYGDPKENHQGIAKIWAPLLQPHWEDIKLGEPLPAHVVALLMAGVKLDRMRRVYSYDNYLDAIVYLSFAHEWQRAHPGKPGPDARRHVYVSGPFSADTPEQIVENIRRANEAGLEIMRRGHLAHVPHTATALWHGKLDYERYMDLDLSVLRRWADSILYLGDSPGAQRELSLARHMGITIYRSVDEIPAIEVPEADPVTVGEPDCMDMLFQEILNHYGQGIAYNPPDSRIHQTGGGEHELQSASGTAGYPRNNHNPSGPVGRTDVPEEANNRQRPTAIGFTGHHEPIDVSHGEPAGPIGGVSRPDGFPAGDPETT